MWELALAPIVFAAIGALLLLCAEQTIGPIIFSSPDPLTVADSPRMVLVDFIAAILGSCAGLAVWYFRQSRTRK